uniref:Vacuolar protease A n=1 Tax=Zeugodacus cucurbitae TaxID=28588 RepID=A0A0A1WD20_ZEUCU
MAMYHQLIIVLSLAVVLHAHTVEWEIKRQENYQLSTDYLNAETAWMCEKHNLVIPTNIKDIPPKPLATKDYIEWEVGTPPQYLKMWPDTFSTITQIRQKTGSLLSFSSNSQNGLAYIVNIITVIASFVITITFGSVNTPLQVFSNEKDNIPPNVGGICGVANNVGETSFIYQMLQKQAIDNPVVTLSFLYPTNERAGVFAAGAWEPAGYVQRTTVKELDNWKIGMKSMYYGSNRIAEEFPAIIDSTCSSLSIGDEAVFNGLMLLIGAYRVNGNVFSLRCSSVSSLEPIRITMGNTNDLWIQPSNYIHKVGDICIVAVIHTPGQYILGGTVLSGRATQRDFNNKTITFYE